MDIVMYFRTWHNDVKKFFGFSSKNGYVLELLDPPKLLSDFRRAGDG
jgi:hypothetical protein